MNQKDTVFVVGGGPAGLAAALALHAKGFRVTVADAADPPVDKVCGEGILPEGVCSLRQLGVRFEPDEAVALRGLRFLWDTHSFQAEFPEAKGLGMRRITLQKKLMEAVERAGVGLLWRTQITGLKRDGVCTKGNLWQAEWIVGADGCGSRVRRWAGMDSGRLRCPRFAFRRHFRCAPWTDFVEVYWTPQCQFYVTPTGKEEICVVLISRKHGLRMEEALRTVPNLAGRLEGREVLSAERGAVTGSRKHHRVVHGNVALVGDAAGMVDAITGEGIRLAVRHAELLADALAVGRPSQYEAAFGRIMRRPRLMEKLLILIGEHPRLRHGVFRVFYKEPEIFKRLLAAHTGQARPKNLAATSARLGWKLLLGGY